MSSIKFAIYTLTFFLLGGLASCEDPLQGFDLQITPEGFKNYSILRVIDINGNAVPHATVALTSGDTKDLYNQDGYKNFKLTKSLVVFCLDPKRVVTPQSPVRFQVSLSASGYVSQQVLLAITGVSEDAQTVVLKKVASNSDS
jgi:hypothetical protein